MSIRKALRNPFVLIGQGFMAGALLFHFTAPEATATPSLEQPIQSASASKSARV